MLEAVVVAHVLGELQLRMHVIDGPVEEALDLIGVQVDGDDAVGACGLQQVGDQAGGDGLTAAVLLVLAGVRVERQHRGDPLGRTTLERIDHDELLHEPLVERRRKALQDKRIGSADRLLEADEDLAVGEVARGLWGDVYVELFGDLLGQLRMRAPREEHQVLLIVGP